MNIDRARLPEAVMGDRYLPSLSYLRAFEATARHLSFTRAALELNLTQTAVSHRIRNLEELTGTKLFDRQGGTVRLTERGREYLDTVRGALATISMATTRMIDRQNAKSLAVATHINFGLKYLIPALQSFRDLHPDISIRLITIPSFEALTRHDYDVAVRYGDGDWPGMTSAALGGETCFPVCSPAFLAGMPLPAAADLAACTVIRTSSVLFGDDWPQWLEAAGAGMLEFGDVIVCDSLYAAVEAGCCGLGIAMGRSSVVGEDIRRGRLVAPFEVRLALASGYHVVSPEESAERPAAAAFKNWLASRFTATPGIIETGPSEPA